MMEPIFAQLSLEYFKAGKNLPWNKVANPIILTEGEIDGTRLLRRGLLYVAKSDVSKARRTYFNL